MSLSFTGERFLPECAGEMVYEHWQRYLIARKYVAGKRVLDVASGEGYGSNLLAADAASVIGVDLSSEAVEHARARYPSANLQYVAASCTQIPLPDASFDVIVSFETIEHITEHEAFLREVDRLLVKDGLFIISSPNRPEYSDKTGYKNEYHVKELDRGELKQLLDTHFPAQRWFAQRAAFHSMVWPLDGPATGAEALTAEGAVAYPAELYFLVFNARSDASLLSVTSTLSLVTDKDASVYAEWSRTYRENSALLAQLREVQDRLAQPAIIDAAAPAAPAIPAASVEHLAAPGVTAAEPMLVRIAKRLSGVR